MKRLSSRMRILVVYMLIAVIPTFILFFINFRNYVNVLDEDTSKSVLQTLKQASANVTNELNIAKNISDMLFENEYIRSSLNLKPAQQSLNEQYDEMKRLRGVLSYSLQNSSICAIRLFVNNEKMYANERINFYPISDFQKDDKINFVTAKGSFIATYSYQYLGEDTKYIISYARYLRDINAIGQTIGALVIDIEEEKISDILAQMQFPQDYHVYIVDAKGIVISHTEKAMLGQLRPVVKDKINGVGEAIYREGNIIHIAKRIDLPDWYLMAEIPEEGIRAGYMAGRANFFLLFFITMMFIGVIGIISTVIVDGMAKRIQQLVSILHDEEDSLHLQEVPTKKRFSIYSSLDQSVSGARRLIRACYEQMEKQKRTQLELLQAQINPHFLYNSLDTINWMIRAGEPSRAEHTINALSRYYRLILNNGMDIVTVDDEVKLANAYIEIQHERFGQSFDAEFIIDPAAQDCLLPKLSLQPLIENAILHGIQKLKERRGRIDVDIYTDAGSLVLSVTDNGVGMNAERAATLLEKAEDKRSSFGLYNVNQRIILFSGYGNNAISIDSEQGKYTTITLTIVERHKKKQV